MNAELIELSERLCEEPHLLHKRLTPVHLAQATYEDRIVVRREGNMIIACAMFQIVPDDEFFELGPIWVRKKFRGAGLCTAVFRECIEKRRGRSLFLITAHEGIKAMASKFLWDEETEDWTTVPLWKRIADPWDDRYPVDSNIKKPGKLFFNYFRP